MPRLWYTHYQIKSKSNQENQAFDYVTNQSNQTGRSKTAIKSNLGPQIDLI